MTSHIILLLLTSPFPGTCLGLELLEWRLCQPHISNLGKWDPIPLDYSPAEMYQYPIGHIPDPPSYGYFETEKH